MGKEIEVGVSSVAGTMDHDLKLVHSGSGRSTMLLVMNNPSLRLSESLSGKVLYQAESSGLCSDKEAEAGESPGFVDAGWRSSERKEADHSTN